jgi:hypothetical protein
LAASLRSNTLVLSFGPSIGRPDVSALCERVRPLLRDGGVRVLICDLGAVDCPDAATVDALARLQLTARSFGCQVQLRHACGELRDLLTLMGLAEVLPLCGESPLEPRGQPEQGEPARGVEEERDAADPIA